MFGRYYILMIKDDHYVFFLLLSSRYPKKNYFLSWTVIFLCQPEKMISGRLWSIEWWAVPVWILDYIGWEDKSATWMLWRDTWRKLRSTLRIGKASPKIERRGEQLCTTVPRKWRGREKICISVCISYGIKLISRPNSLAVTAVGFFFASNGGLASPRHDNNSMLVLLPPWSSSFAIGSRRTQGNLPERHVRCGFLTQGIKISMKNVSHL